MTDFTRRFGRRAVLQSAAGIAAIELLASRAQAAAPSNTTPATSTGSAGDFDFLAGEWQISHRRLKSEAEAVWDEFAGEATCWSVLSGAGSIEELRIPARNFFGLGIRLLDIEKKIWADHWVSARSGVLGLPGLTGVFKDGAGVFIAEDTDDGKPIKVRGLWDEITPKSCRWSQAVSRDNGATWRDNWVMHWRRK
jgi:hypothetical protein